MSEPAKGHLKKVLIFGSEGMLACECADSFSSDFDVRLVTHRECDITDESQVTRKLIEIHPDIVVNCAGMIDVNACEKKEELAYQVNAQGPENIARAIKMHFSSGVFIQFSTCYVFGNQKRSYDEADIPAPINVYGKTKLVGEQLIQKHLSDSSISYYIIRTTWLYSKYRKTFVDFVVDALKKNEEVDISDDQFNTVTWAKDLTDACKNFIVKPTNFQSGIYHISAYAEEPPSKIDIALTCAEICDLPSELLIPTHSNTLFTEKRPVCAFLTTTKKITLPDWKESLHAYLLQKI